MLLCAEPAQADGMFEGDITDGDGNSGDADADSSANGDGGNGGE